MTGSVAVVALLAGCGEPPPEMPWTSPLSLRMTGCEYQWQLSYAGRDGCLDTEDDVRVARHLHLPAHTAVQLELTSCDLLYTFASTGIGFNELAVPGQPYVLQLQTGAPGEYTFRGDQLCGFSHEELSGRVVIHPREEFSRWLATAAADRTHSGVSAP